MFRVYIKIYLFWIAMILPAFCMADLAVTDFVEGKQYERVAPDIISHKNVQEFIAQNTDKIQVLEFFSYACYGCSQVHPILTEWDKEKPKNVVFYRFPLGFNPQWNVLAKAYYVAKELNQLETFDAKFFKAIHIDHVNLSTDELVKKYFMAEGVPEKSVEDAYRSFNVNRELAKAATMADAYRISLSPVVIINGPSGSYILNAKMAGGKEGFVKIINYLIERESAKLPGS